METQSCCTPLKESALRTAAFNLWTESVLEAIAEKDYNWCVEERVAIKLWEFKLPEKIQREIMAIVNRLCFNVMKWKLHTEKYIVDENAAFNEHTVPLLHLTENNNVDYQKTAERLVECEMLDVVDRFKIACWYCLEDKIRLFWEELPAERKAFYAEKFRVQEEVNMLSYWCFVLREEGPNLDQLLEEESLTQSAFYRKAFLTCVLTQNIAATKYFYTKLDEDDDDIELVVRNS